MGRGFSKSASSSPCQSSKEDGKGHRERSAWARSGNWTRPAAGCGVSTRVPGKGARQGAAREPCRTTVVSVTCEGSRETRQLWHKCAHMPTLEHEKGVHYVGQVKKRQARWRGVNDTGLASSGKCCPKKQGTGGGHSAVQGSTGTGNSRIKKG